MGEPVDAGCANSANGENLNQTYLIAILKQTVV
jgi:hypothetical protein